MLINSRAIFVTLLLILIVPCKVNAKTCSSLVLATNVGAADVHARSGNLKLAVREYESQLVKMQGCQSFDREVSTAGADRYITIQLISALFLGGQSKAAMSLATPRLENKLLEKQGLSVSMSFLNRGRFPDAFRALIASISVYSVPPGQPGFLELREGLVCAEVGNYVRAIALVKAGKRRIELGRRSAGDFIFGSIEVAAGDRSAAARDLAINVRPRIAYTQPFGLDEFALGSAAELIHLIRSRVR